MNDTLLMIIAALLLVLIAVFAYNMVQENRYRNKIRSQFGHSDEDVLMGRKTQSVRDGKDMTHEKLKPSKIKPTPTKQSKPPKPVAAKAPITPVEPITSLDQPSLHTRSVPDSILDDDNVASISMDKTSDLIAPEKLVKANLIATETPVKPKRDNIINQNNQNNNIKKESKLSSSLASLSAILKSDKSDKSESEKSEKSEKLESEKFEKLESEKPEKSDKLEKSEKSEEKQDINNNIKIEITEDEKIIRTEQKQKEIFAPVKDGLKDTEIKKSLLINLHDLSRSQLSWFDNRVDYLAYVSLREAQELYAIPRLSNRYRFQIIGCTMDGLFQVAEPIPGVLYQGFAIGLQAISRNGLASSRELELFGHQVKSFADKMGGEILLTDIDEFLYIAQPLDEICERVDQTIAIHLVSRISILGIELRSTLEELGFQLMQDGTFGFSEVGGDVKYSAVSLDGSQFTSSLLASQPYKGFSMLFDITRVPQGESNFDEFMNLAVKLSSKLNLELVDDQIQELSTEWLREVRSYVLDRQNEMLKVGIEPAGELAQRLFA